MFGRDGGVPWYEARRDATGLAPDPATTQEAVVQVFAARAVAWRGYFAVHTWIVVKPTGAPRYTRYEVVGFGVANGAPAIRIDRTGPDNYWFGAAARARARPPRRRRRRADRENPRRGPGLSLSARISRLARPQQQHLHRLRRAPVPELGLALPSNAIGKDYLPGGALLPRRPAARAIQVSLFGLAGFLVARAEGYRDQPPRASISASISPRPALMLPGIGRLGVPRLQPG